MNQKERLLKILGQKPVDRPAAAVPTQPAITEVMVKSGYSWPKALREAEAMAGLAWACHEIGGIENVRVPFDITVEAEAIGCITRFSDDMDTPPMAAPMSRAEFQRIRQPDPVRDGRMPEVLNAIGLLKERTGDAIPVIAALGTPFEVLSTALSYEDITEAIYGDPDFLSEQLEALTDFTIRYAGEMVKAGADILMLVDGTSQTLGPGYYEKVSFPYTKKMVETISIPTILHICGDSTSLIKQMVDTGVRGLSIDKAVNTQEIMEFTKGRVALVGKVSPQILCFGSRKEVIGETRESLMQGMDVIAPGCGVLPQTPLENLRTSINYIKNWKRKGRDDAGGLPVRHR